MNRDRWSWNIALLNEEIIANYEYNIDTKHETVISLYIILTAFVSYLVSFARRKLGAELHFAKKFLNV